jgi:hypothetical protein
MTRRIVLAPLLLLLPTVAVADDPKPAPKVIPAAEAKDHLGETVVVEMTVKSSKDADTRKEHYLDSEADFHDPKNAVVVIAYEHLPAFKKAGIEDPSKHYLDKTIRVAGTLKKEGTQVRMRIDDPKHITIVEAKK